MIRANLGLVGEPDEIKEQIAEMAKAGVKEVLLLLPVKCAQENFGDFAEVVH